MIPEHAIPEISAEDYTARCSAGERFLCLDIRDDAAFAQGHLPGAVHILQEEVQPYLEDPAHFSPESPQRSVLIVCDYGKISLDIAEELQDRLTDLAIYSLKGGYGAYALYEIRRMASDQEKLKQIEHSLTKAFHTPLFSRFAKAIVQYDLVEENDHIAVCISGGKDSFLMAKLFQELKRHRKFPFEVTYLVMDPGYSAENRAIIENNARLLDIPVRIFETTIFDVVDTVTDSPCYLCARMRRGYLYKAAQDAGCNKIALGHHYDDVIETTPMGMLYAGQFQAMMPKLKSTNFPGMELIRPMYFVREADIIRFRDTNGLHFIRCACHFTDTCSTIRSDGDSTSKRIEVKHLIASLKKDNPQIEQNLFKATENVVLDKVLGYKKDGVRHSFLEEY